jgi:hypothetical protein
MGGRETHFQDTCEITGIKNGITVPAEILTFREKDVIIATVNRAAKVTLKWQKNAGLYVGSLAGVEFQSSGPKSHTYRTRR